mmetsp:Transcript_86088/g.239597  ORF Transcript_86088/g.239597 Transcript_86088/m.239597 type:complete len:319 (+) Transcript_86088:163-1119(+)
MRRTFGGASASSSRSAWTSSRRTLSCSSGARPGTGHTSRWGCRIPPTTSRTRSPTPCREAMAGHRSSVSTRPCGTSWMRLSWWCHARRLRRPCRSPQGCSSRCSSAAWRRRRAATPATRGRRHRANAGGRTPRRRCRAWRHRSSCSSGSSSSGRRRGRSQAAAFQAARTEPPRDLPGPVGTPTAPASVGPPSPQRARPRRRVVRHAAAATLGQAGAAFPAGLASRGACPRHRPRRAAAHRPRAAPPGAPTLRPAAWRGARRRAMEALGAPAPCLAAGSAVPRSAVLVGAPEVFKAAGLFTSLVDRGHLVKVAIPCPAP